MGAFYLIGGLFLLFFSIGMSSKEKASINKIDGMIRNDKAVHHYNDDIQSCLKFQIHTMLEILGYKDHEEYMDVTKNGDYSAYVLRDVMRSLGYDYRPMYDTIENEYAAQRFKAGRHPYPCSSYKGTDLEGL